MKWEKWQELIKERNKRLGRNLKKIDELRDETFKGLVGNLLNLIVRELGECIEIFMSMEQDSDLSADERLAARQSFEDFWLQSRKGFLGIKKSLEETIDKFKKAKGESPDEEKYKT